MRHYDVTAYLSVLRQVYRPVYTSDFRRGFKQDFLLLKDVEMYKCSSLDVRIELYQVPVYSIS